LDSFSIQLAASDSHQLNLKGLIENGTEKIPVKATDTDGTDISTKLLIRFASLDPSQATVNKTGTVTAVSPGRARITASTTYYGVTRSDTVQLRIGYPDAVALMTQGLNIGPIGFTPASATISTGGTVVFKYSNFGIVGNKLDVTFDDSTVAQRSPLDSSITHALNGSGNVSPLTLPSSAMTVIPVNDSVMAYLLVAKVCNAAPYPCAVMRAFPKAGIYHYHGGTGGGVDGTIYVMDNPQ
jgi:hypothetical protein